MQDQEFKEKLKHAGYDVPEIVIKTWGKSGPRRQCNIRRSQVESYLKRIEQDKRSRDMNFPQFLANFDIRIKGIIRESGAKRDRPYRKSAEKAAA